MSDLIAPAVTLDRGVTMPTIGFGTAHLTDETAAQALEKAFAAGYRKVDTATAYTNETGVGLAIAASGLLRDEVFVTTKVWNNDQGRDAVRPALLASLGRLALDHVDLYLLHWPAPALGRFIESYQVLEQLRDEGLTRAIGVSNFQPHHLRQLLSATTVTPAVNQIELHPYLQQQELRALHDELGIVTEAWSPLGQGCLLNDPVLLDIAHQRAVTTAQVVLAWHLQRGTAVIPRSQDQARIRANLATLDVAPLDEADLCSIDKLDQDRRLGPHPDEFDGR
ncbi:aldo/keto reductase [Fodinicola feengrottensis]|uniref:Aldo/keto reductase n=1 Tax=Fodinicola feengrottensis TaxID=435914 RepID=A0ABN2IE56_9ACTN|nr:aldo/keto reductase [Fodinicola feengrottensis]